MTIPERLADLLIEAVGPSRILRTAARHHLQDPGKLVRARIAYAVARGVYLGNERSSWVSAVCEMLHNASLVLDDLHDQEETRRGVNSVWFQYGTVVATNLTTAWLNAASRHCLEHLGPQACRMLHDAVDRAVEGQTEEAMWSEYNVPSLEDYHRVAGNKTGALLALPLTLPMGLAGVERPAIDRVGQALADFGLSYQIRDDLEDLGRPDDPIGDLARGRWTLPSILYCATAGSDDVALVQAAIGGRLGRSSLQRLLGRIQSSSVIAECQRLADERERSFQTIARTLPDSIQKPIFEALERFAAEGSVKESA